MFCPPGYVCDFGTTPDVSIEAPRSKYEMLCPEGYICPKGTGFGQRYRIECPVGYFCPTGTSSIELGRLANDAVNRDLDEFEANPFINIVEYNKRLPGEFTLYIHPHVYTVLSLYLSIYLSLSICTVLFIYLHCPIYLMLF